MSSYNTAHYSKKGKKYKKPRKSSNTNNKNNKNNNNNKNKKQKSVNNKKEEKKSKYYKPKVQKITASTYENFNKTANYFYIYFSKKNSKLCDKFNKIYDKLSSKASNRFPMVKFAKVDSTEKALIRKFSVDAFPTVYWVNKIDREIFQYNGKLKSKSLMKFINEQTNSTTIEIQNEEELKNNNYYLNGKYLVFLGNTTSHEREYKIILKQARDHSIDYILNSHSEFFLNKFNLTNDKYDVVIYRKKNGTLCNGERFNIPTKEGYKLSKRKVEKMIDIFIKSPWGRLNEFTLEQTFLHKNHLPTFLYIYNPIDSNNNNIKEEDKLIEKNTHDLFVKLANKYRKSFSFLNTTHNSRYYNITNEVFKFKKQDLPKLVLLKHKKSVIDDVEKYVFDASTKHLNEEYIEKIIGYYKAKNLIYLEQFKLIFNEERIDSQNPKNNFIKHPDGIVEVNAKGFQQRVINNTEQKLILLVLCTKKSLACNALRPRLAKIHRKLGSNDNFDIILVDPLHNEITNIKYHRIPTIYFINSSIKAKKKYTGNYLTKDIVNFIVYNAHEKHLNFNIISNEDEMHNKEVKVKKIKPRNKHKEVDPSEDNFNIGLKRIVKYELTRLYPEEPTEEDLDDEYLNPNDYLIREKKYDL